MSNANTPEDFLLASDKDRFPIDAINCAHQRADSILTMLIAVLGGQSELEFNPHLISNALWQVQGTLEQIKIMTDHSYRETHHARKT